MSFLNGIGRSCEPQSREAQFLRYFHETGASKSLQKAMILLYEMPIKPTNIMEFFAEYFDNGSTDLVSLSLLRAELCFKHSQVEDAQNRVKDLEARIDCFKARGIGLKKKVIIEEPADPDAADQSVFSALLTIDEDTPAKPPPYSVSHLPSPSQKGSITEREWMIDRYFYDLMDRNPDDQSIVASEAPSQLMDFDMGEVGEEDEEEEEGEDRLEDEEEDGEEEEEDDTLNEPPTLLDEDEELEKRQNDAEEWEKTIKAFDPWRMICRPHFGTKNFQGGPITNRTSPTKLAKRKTLRKSLRKSLRKTIGKQQKSTTGTIGVILDNLSSDSDKDSIYNDDSDDAATLADIFHSAAYDPSKPLNPEKNEVVQTEEENKLLTVEQPNDHLLKELLEWSGIPEKRRETLWTMFTSKASIDVIAAYERRRFSRVTSKIELGSGDKCVEETAPCILAANLWLDGIKQGKGDGNDDGILLYEQEIAKLAKKYESGDHTDEAKEGFMYEFYQQFPNLNQQEKESACGRCSHWERKSSVKKIDESTSTKDIDDCLCGENCECIWDGKAFAVGKMAYKNSQPHTGKMINWTKDYEGELPGEDYDAALGESQDANSSHRRSSAGKKKYSSAAEENLSPTKSSCECSAGSSESLSRASFTEGCAAFCESRVQDEPNFKAPPVHRDKVKRAVEDPVMAETFKTTGGYANEVIRDEAQNLRNSGKRNNSLVDPVAQQYSTEIKKLFIPDDLFETSLENQIRKSFGFI